jgi:membrane associated rhomboid family serine protease
VHAACHGSKTALKNPSQTESSNGSQPVLNVPTVVLVVVGLLIAVHVAFWLLGEEWLIWRDYALSFIPARLGGGEIIPAPRGAVVWSFFTYALLHADVYHLGFNCVWLLIFSSPLARRLGATRYVLLLLLSAAAGAAAMLPLHWGKFLVVIGASGSVSAALAAAIPVMFAPGFRMSAGETIDHRALAVVRPSELLRNSRAVAFALLFLVMTLFTGASMALTGTAFLEESQIAWEAHLGGFIAGLILFYLLDRKPVHTS